MGSGTTKNHYSIVPEPFGIKSNITYLSRNTPRTPFSSRLLRLSAPGCCISQLQIVASLSSLGIQHKRPRTLGQKMSNTKCSQAKSMRQDIFESASTSDERQLLPPSWSWPASCPRLRRCGCTGPGPVAFCPNRIGRGQEAGRGQQGSKDRSRSRSAAKH